MVIEKNNLLSDFSLTLYKNERVAVTGPSGCGKSTLLKSLIKKKFPTGSTYRKFNSPSNFTSAYIPQSSGLLPWYSLRKNIAIFSKEKFHTENVITHFNLQNSLKNFPHQLSGGEYQRAILANALIGNPEVYYADEPLTELDINNKWKLLSFWSDHLQKTKASLFLVSHDIETLLYLCDKIVVVSDKPSSVIKELKINSTHPRSIDFLISEEFTIVKKELLDSMSSDK